MMDRSFSRAKPPVEFKCTACQQVFRRVEHLRRHLSTHVDTRPHVCSFCNSQFKRSDALRRHWKTCTARLASGNAVPQRSLSGKRKQSCDCCAERKRACDLGKPCSECQTRGSECTYHRVGYAFSKSPPSMRGDTKELYPKGKEVASFPTNGLLERDHGQESAQLTESIARRFPSHDRLDYLRNFTRAKGINQAYNYKRAFMSDFPDGKNSDIPPMSGQSADEILAANQWSYLLDGLESEIFGISDNSQLNASLSEGLNEVLNLFLSRLNKQDSDLTPRAVEFFTPQNTLRYLDLFWDRWYPHCPIIHRATFELQSCPSLLLMTMSLIGACTSFSASDREAAQSLLDTAESVLFSHPSFSDEIGSARERGTNHVEVRILQATYFMCILQKWEGNDAAKRRIQRSRFTTFVAAIRSLGLSRGTHGKVNFEEGFAHSSWRTYVRKEEMIRTFNFAFLLDSAFVIFHNSVPRMVLQEMTIDIPCPEEWFQASSSEEFISLFRSYPGMTQSPTLLSDCVRQLCTDAPDTDIVAYLSNASKLGLFTIATGIHGLIFHQKMSYTPLPYAKTLLSKALNRWITAWQQSLQHLGPSDPSLPLWKEDGFIGHADDFAALAQIHLECANTSQEKWDELTKQLPVLAQNAPDGMATFDQTNMDQVANLITAVELLDLANI
ncbi:fungal-specific transcription factor domain-containing protein [Aspergillus ambiguus]|uniref:transcription factor domain-containing protein n=1 Tax=Aspergillus ambiguus TaxID=176160 RepID=UPI003CCCA2F9